MQHALDTFSGIGLDVGLTESQPTWLATWLLIITDNILHVLINGVALRRRG